MTFREIRGTFGRFFAIFAIIALGVGFFSGVRITTPVMVHTVDEFYKDHGFYDYRALSTLGFEEQDAQTLRDETDAAAVEGGWQYDVIIENGAGENAVYKVLSIPEEVNTLRLMEGRFPENASECVMDADNRMGLSIGDTILFSDQNKTDTLDAFESRRYTVTGFVNSSLYLYFERGTTSVGNGLITGFLYLPRDAFANDYYTDLYVKLESVSQIFSEDYTERMDQARSSWENAVEDAAEDRYGRIVADAQGELDDAKSEFADKKADGEKELADAEAELADGKKKLDDAAKELADGKKELDDGAAALADGKRELDEAAVTLSDSEKQLKDAEKELADGWKTLTESEEELKSGKEQLDASKIQFDEAKETIDASETELNEGKVQLDETAAVLEEGKKQLDASGTELEKAKVLLDENAAVLAEGKTKLDETEAVLAEGKEQLDATAAQLTEGKEQLDATAAQLAEGKEQLDATAAQLAEGKAQLDATAAQLAEGKEQLDEAAAQLQAAEAQIAAAEAMYDFMDEEQKAAFEQYKAQYLAGKEQYEAKLAEYEAGKAQYDAGLAEYEAGKAQYDAGLAEYEAGKAQYDAGLAEYESGKAQYDAAVTEYEAGKAQYDAAVTEYEAGKAQYDAGLAEYESGKAQYDAAVTEYEAGKAQYEEGLAAYEAGKEQLEEGKKEYEDGKAQYDAAVKEYEDGVKQFDEGVAEYWNGVGQYKDGKAQYLDGLKQYYDGLREYEENAVKYEDAVKEYEDGVKEYEDGLAEYEDGLAEYEDGKRTFDREIADAEKKIADAQQELDDLDPPDTYLLERNTNTGYEAFRSDSEIVHQIAKVFPVFFILVAILVCMTTMTRMVDEQRGQIGVLKGLGYTEADILKTFLIYSGSAAMLGCIFGYAAGIFLFPTVLWMAYQIMYIHQPLRYLFDLKLAFAVTAVSMLCSIGTTYLTVRRELKESAASLMRPRAPKAGKRVFLEYIRPLWSRMNFQQKISARNILRYKKRFFMMVLGISGCTALVLTGFGIKDSINSFAETQYTQIQVADADVTFRNAQGNALPPEIEAAMGELGASYRIYESSAWDLLLGKTVKSINVIAPFGTEDMDEYFRLRTPGGDVVELPGEGGALISVSLSERYGISPGDPLRLRNEDMRTIDVHVTGVFENHVYNYVILDPATIAAAEGECVPNAAYVNFPEGADIYEAQKVLAECDDVSYVTLYKDFMNRLTRMMDSLNYVVLVIILSAAGLALIVLYNLTNINILERIREIATIKVLGFFPRETARYVFRENLVLTLIGSLAGLVMGKFLHRFVMQQIVVDIAYFNVTIRPVSYLWAVLLTFVFTIFVNKLMGFRIEKINMAESLKSVE